MRTPVHVTQQAFELPDNATLMSTTDTQSHITYANAAFIEASGYSAEELLGQPHNLVRHPDMPREAFADMWATLQGGEPWTGLVKNRRKNGDHYWVRANATPIVRGGMVAGYMSVRTKPSREEVAGAEKLYRAFREGTAGTRRFHKGLVVRTGPGGWTTWAAMPVRWRLRCAPLALAAALVAASAAVGTAGGPLWLLAGVAALASALACGWLDWQVARPLARVHDEALRVASGASRQAVPMDRVDEIGMTLRTIGQLGLMFRWLVDDVRHQALGVQSASREIVQGNDDLSVRTEQAAASVQQTAAAMVQMMAAVQSNSETALQANQLSGSASSAAEAGGRTMSGVVATMKDISQSSRRIGDIIGVIDSIAFQTNILALNAAVEAARAGEQGRGFAVVAGEVRGLAQRSAAAAREIRTLIGASVERVESGSRHVDGAGTTMGDIVAQVRQVSSLIAEISSSTAQQRTGISEVGQAVSELDRITQQNAALVEQSAAASHSLNLQASQLAEAVSVFR